MTYFIFCIHNHQPVGNFEHVLEEAFQRSYWPFLQSISKHPKIKLAIHNSGFLFDWIVEKHPEYIDLLRSMVVSGQAEILGGGYYEPILPVIPEGDRLAQLNMMSDKIEDVFKVRPRGIWLAERVWEPSLPSVLKKAGIEYLIVDDYHFIKSGLRKEELGGYYITEDNGHAIKILPGSEVLRYMIPFKPVDDLDYLKGFDGPMRRGGNAAIYGDDGEKFGVWPGTYKWVFEEGWLDNFLEKIEKLNWLVPVTIQEYLRKVEPLGQVYLPTTSYMEMGEWSLPAASSLVYSEIIEEINACKEGDNIRRFIQGGTWRNFFSKYPESNWMHKRMLMVSSALRERGGRIGKAALDRAEEFLYKAQCNDSYWHGVFGGLYLPHLRTKVYENLLNAENIALAGDDTAIFLSDIDADNREEVIIRTKELNLFLSPHNGGALFELDFKPRAVNLSNTLARRFEAYHHKLEVREGDEHGGQAKSIHDIIKSKEKGLKDYLKYDKSRRSSFVDHFIGKGETLESFYSCEYKELGDFSGSRYEVEMRDNGVILSRSAKAGEDEFFIAKGIDIKGDNSFDVNYRVSSPRRGDREKDCRFGVEFNFILPCCDGPACYYELSAPVKEKKGGLGSFTEVDLLDGITLADTFSAVAINISIDKPATLWKFPVYTVSISEDGFEKIFQGTCLLFLFPLEPSVADGRNGTNLAVNFIFELQGLNK